ncbi:gamma-glutamylcyclotransferase-like [Daktulosphaira vitifoliae]|uniref:gamma-glutamylcyclotransferase-like n=1 Tax=Daktulosphaira vitifoliae TaxID=58002 RepID=UPI0021A9AD10|nr:gamma-glutamylcyclotransferase-like [Daktulosphaira vitifoliae]
MKMTMVFFYFAYGSNLLAERIHLNNPSAIREGSGKLNGYRLDFNGPKSNFWKGSPATVVPDTDEYVWGSVWKLNISDLQNLDKQEGVPQKLYIPFETNIELSIGQTILCRSYMLNNLPQKETILPPERRPSEAYLETILLGAKESNLPSEYIEKLKLIPHNNCRGPIMPWSSLKINDDKEL